MKADLKTESRFNRRTLTVAVVVAGLILLIVILFRSMIPGVSLSLDQSRGSTEFVFSTHGINGLLSMRVLRYDPGELLWHMNLNYFRGHRLRYGEIPDVWPNIARQEFPKDGEEPKPLAPDSKFLVTIECQHDVFIAPSVTSVLFILRTDKTGRVVSVENVDRNKPFEHPLEEHPK